MAEENKVQWVYSSRNNQELAERYDQWAAEYDRDLEDDFGWLAPQRCCDAFAEYVDKSASILDAGAGTGLVGQILAQMGYLNLIAMDMSKGMLDASREKNVYQEFHQMVMGQHLDFPTGAFDAVITVGVLTVGHAPAESMDELVRITKPGGHIVFSLRPDVYQNDGFKEKQDQLETENKWKLVLESEPFQPLPKGEPEVLHQVWVYQAL
ncbi:MAG: SAM-dependent methyltransferase [SAR202 cluster bacterium Io17-Chloro-G9]|nr:MAG: SAM-dependent methyltransferase [SAR202 cluster bacterium Io17-Chloro-G9]